MTLRDEFEKWLKDNDAPDDNFMFSDLVKGCMWETYQAAHTAQQKRVEELEDALITVINCVPACVDGTLVVEHYGSEGEYLGSEHIDPLSVIQAMHETAEQALSATAREK
ncbi:MAG: hypothetical protein Q8L60_10890 [Gammaproteobacteria bacterium]|nr:hypothetical protein [Gammaproteobacteria bacterium]MDP2346853.1 hypothetical protein [Gammaproteobacteria bacterium]